MTTHLVTIEPPSPHRQTWLAVCSENDFAQSYRNRVEAFIASNTHVNDVMVLNELEQGTYQFDDGRG